MNEMTRRNHAKLISDIISNLPEPSQHILSLYYIDQLSFKEIAKVLELPEIQVRAIFVDALHSCIASGRLKRANCD